MKEVDDYYVYVYIDPRNYEEFYYGKGKGSRKNAHLTDDGDSEKATRIKAIKQKGQKPIIKVVARGLTEKEAYLIEKTLIWKLGRTLTNVSSGHYAEKFRPHDTFHQELAGFDFRNGLYYVCVGEWHQDWADCVKFGFVAAGQGKVYSDPLKSLEPGDLIAAYIPKRGYAGIGKVDSKAIRINDFKFQGKPLRHYPLMQIKNTFKNCEDDELTDYYVKIKWIKNVNTSREAKWKTNSGLFASQIIRASLQAQPKTVAFLEKEFGVDFRALLLTEE